MWIGRSGPFSRPPCLPALTPLDFLWGHMNTIAYATKPHLLEKLKAKITYTISSITINHLANVFGELQNHINLRMTNDAGHEET